MHSEKPPVANATLVGTALSIAPAAIGCAVGLLIADKMRRSTRNTVTTTLLTLGALATLPLAVDFLARTVNSPSFGRGSRRRLESIRHGGFNPDADIYGLEAEDLVSTEEEPGSVREA